VLLIPCKPWLVFVTTTHACWCACVVLLLLTLRRAWLLHWVLLSLSVGAALPLY